jgi:hypothetical protein
MDGTLMVESIVLRLVCENQIQFNAIEFRNQGIYIVIVRGVDGNDQGRHIFIFEVNMDPVHIVIPSYTGHFSEIERFCLSHSTYNLDCDVTTVHLVVGDSEVDLFRTLIPQYPKNSINVYSFKALMSKYFCNIDEQQFLKAHGKETFQSFKKMCGMLECDQGLIFLTDSETYFIRKCHLSKEMHATKSIFYSDKPANNVQRMALSIASTIIDAANPPWIGLVFNYQWIFNKAVVHSLYCAYKDHILSNIKQYFFIEILIYVYMWKHMRSETDFVNLTSSFINRCPEHFWSTYDPKKDADVLDTIMSKKNVFCYSVQNTGRFKENQQLIHETSNIKILTSTPELFDVPVPDTVVVLVPERPKTVALLLRGISYGSYQHFTKTQYTIDFRDNFGNVDAMLLQPLKAGGMDVNVFCVTYDNPYMDALKDLYKPIAVSIEPFNPTQDNYVMHMISRCLELVLAQAKQYDLIIMTRFDINLMLSILDIPYRPDKVNFTCTTVDGGVDDTLLIFSGRYLQMMFRLASTNLVYDFQHRLHKAIKPKYIIHYMSPQVYASITTGRPYILFNRELYNSFTASFCMNNMLWNVLYKSSGALMKGCYKSGVWAFLKRRTITTPEGFSYSSEVDGPVSFDIRFITMPPDTVSLNGTLIDLASCKQGEFVRINTNVTIGSRLEWMFSQYSPEIHLHIKNIIVGNERVDKPR